MICPEGGPESFKPPFHTAGTALDASSRAVYNRLVESERDSLAVVPTLTGSWEL